MDILLIKNEVIATSLFSSKGVRESIHYKSVSSLQAATRYLENHKIDGIILFFGGKREISVKQIQTWTKANAKYFYLCLMDMGVSSLEKIDDLLKSGIDNVLFYDELSDVKINRSILVAKKNFEMRNSKLYHTKKNEENIESFKEKILQPIENIFARSELLFSKNKNFSPECLQIRANAQYLLNLVQKSENFSPLKQVVRNSFFTWAHLLKEYRSLVDCYCEKYGVALEINILSDIPKAFIGDEFTILSSLLEMTKFWLKKADKKMFLSVCFNKIEKNSVEKVEVQFVLADTLFNSFENIAHSQNIIAIPEIASIAQNLGGNLSSSNGDQSFIYLSLLLSLPETAPKKTNNRVVVYAHNYAFEIEKCLKDLDFETVFCRSEIETFQEIKERKPNLLVWEVHCDEKPDSALMKIINKTKQIVLYCCERNKLYEMGVTTSFFIEDFETQKFMQLVLNAVEADIHCKLEKELKSLIKKREHLHLLVIENSQDNHNLMQGLLGPSNCSIDSVVNSQIALQNIDKKKYDLILLDKNNGTEEALKQLAQTWKKQETRPTPVIVLSREMENKNIPEWASIVRKPIGVKDLIQTIIKHVPIKIL